MRFLVLILFFAITACKRDGTDTGNPATNLDGSTTTSYQVVQGTCEKIVLCHPEAAVETCIQSQYSIALLGAKLGLTGEQQAWTFLEITMNEQMGLIAANSENANICVQDIQQMSCSETQLSEAYNTSLTHPYQELWQVLAPSCQDVF